MKKRVSLAIFLIAALGAVTATAQSQDGTDIGSGTNPQRTVRSSEVSLNASRIRERVVLFSEESANGAVVQILAESQGGSTDFSNGLRLILSISAYGEMSGNEASFVITDALKLNSAQATAPGIYRVSYDDANTDDYSKLTKVITIDARQALQAVQNSPCEEFEICAVNTAVNVQ